MTCDTCDSFGYLLTAPATYQSGGEMVSCPVCQPSLTAGAVKAANLADFEMVDELRRRGWSVRPAVKPTEAGAIDCLAEQYEAEGSPLTAEELRAGGNPHNSRWTIRAMLAFARNPATPSQRLDAATVERCAQVADMFVSRQRDPATTEAGKIAARIRALAAEGAGA